MRLPYFGFLLLATLNPVHTTPDRRILHYLTKVNVKLFPVLLLGLSQSPSQQNTGSCDKIELAEEKVKITWS
jgi:hypothetical protein